VATGSDGRIAAHAAYIRTGSDRAEVGFEVADAHQGRGIGTILLAHLAEAAAENAGRARPKVYFEEWDEPMISGIGWVSDLIGYAGGQDVFPDLSRAQAAKDRIVTAEQVIAAAPDVILASWCGKRVNVERIRSRPGWHAIPAVAAGRIHEIKSPLILQPGPAALTDGFAALRAALAVRQSGG
jgi:iron complex transport system substrate-binding protein